MNLPIGGFAIWAFTMLNISFYNQNSDYSKQLLRYYKISVKYYATNNQDYERFLNIYVFSNFLSGLWQQKYDKDFN
jgi:hypothetical protein